MHDVFISYSTINKNVADAVVADFEQHGIKCWYAPRDIFPGEEWVSAISNALENSKVLVLIYTPESNKSRQVMNEIALAFNAGLTIVPFRLSDEQMSRELEYYLTRVHWLDALSSSLQNSIEELRKYIDMITRDPDINISFEQRADIINSADKKKKTIKGTIIAVAFVFLLIATVIFTRYYAMKLTEDVINAKLSDEQDNEDQRSEANEQDSLYTEADDLYNRAKKLEATGDTASASECYKKAFDLYSEFAESGDGKAMKILGDMYYAGTGADMDEEKAKENYLSAETAGIEDAEMFNRIGLIYFGEEDYSSAASYFTESIKLKEDVIVIGNAALAYDNAGDRENAIIWYRKAIDAGHRDAEKYKKRIESLEYVRSHSIEHEYIHGEDGYYNLLEDGVEYELASQLSGTCWICAASCAMITDYQLNHEGNIELGQIDLLYEIYDDDKNEGVFVSKGVSKEKLGGTGIFVVNELSQGFSDGLAIDRAIDAKGWTMDAVKEGIRKYGALYIGIPDTDQSKKGTFDGYYTMNYPEPEESSFDHSIAVLGWDDNFPKEYFRKEASRNGAWITYNSNHPSGYYYVSYDTPFDQSADTPLFMSVTKEYSKVLSVDGGYWYTDPVITGKTTTTANVFKGKGTLAAVGTFSLSDEQDITIQIMTADLNECIYSQEFHADHKGYQVFRLDKNLAVDEYAIAVTYSSGAPVEGESVKLDYSLSITAVSEKDQSFIKLDDEWLDMSERTTWDRLGCVTNNACIKALYID
ncbi:MAG: TIR domain-containing protein [Lachnospiraceae bacterium]|nr:TIR domain-containing protein [Lachnospiraceae bacterium]